MWKSGEKGIKEVDESCRGEKVHTAKKGGHTALLLELEMALEHPQGRGSWTWVEKDVWSPLSQSTRCLRWCCNNHSYI